jgi:GNAT superfamily N-acetyltransferase
MKDTYKVVEINWEEIKHVWDQHLWVGRDSKPTNNWAWDVNNPKEFTTSKWQTQWSVPIFLGVYDGDRNTVGVNSVYQSSEDGMYYRSRGLFVHPLYRRTGVAGLLLKASVDWARQRDCSKYLFSAPRKPAIPAYESAGFITHGKLFEATRSGDNFIASVKLF